MHSVNGKKDGATQTEETPFAARQLVFVFDFGKRAGKWEAHHHFAYINLTKTLAVPCFILKWKIVEMDLRYKKHIFIVKF